MRRVAASVTGLRVGYDPCGEAEQIGLARSGDWPEFAQKSQTAMPQALTIHLALDLRLRATDHRLDLIGVFQTCSRLVDCVALHGDEPDAVDLAQGLVAMAADQKTTDDPAGLFYRFQKDAGIHAILG